MSVGQLLQHYRKSQHFSQLALATEAEISSRHISFIETGRSQPSRQVLLTLANAMDLAHRDVNLLMRTAGYSAMYQHRGLDDPQMKPVSDALNMMLENHLPYPSVVIDKDWNILMMNASYQQLLSSFPMQLNDNTNANNVLELLFSPNGLRSVIANWDEVASHLLRVRAREEALNINQGDSLLKRLLAYPNIPDWKKINDAEIEKPMLSLQLNLGQVTLNLFSTITTFGTAADITLQELRIESYFPADEQTKDFFTANSA